MLARWILENISLYLVCRCTCTGLLSYLFSENTIFFHFIRIKVKTFLLVVLHYEFSNRFLYGWSMYDVRIHMYIKHTPSCLARQNAYNAKTCLINYFQLMLATSWRVLQRDVIKLHPHNAMSC